MTHHSPVSPPPGISGKRVTAWVIAGLVVLGFGLSYTLWTYNALDATRSKSAVAWRQVTESLAARYRTAEQELEAGVSNGEATEDFARQFHSAIDAFRTTSIVSDQVVAAERVEELIGSDQCPNSVRQSLELTAQRPLELDEYNEFRQRERILLHSFGGRILDIFLEFPGSQDFRLATSPVKQSTFLPQR